MAGVAACGCFMISSNEMEARAFAFMASVLLWQAHYVVMMWEADWMKSAGRKMQERCLAAPPVAAAAHETNSAGQQA